MIFYNKILELEHQRVRIEQGELVSFQKEGYELIHQKGSPGWRQSDTEMFPIIGPLDLAGFRIQTPRGMAAQDQHGLLRELRWRLVFDSDTEVFYRKNYEPGTEIRNSKFPARSAQEWLHWPYRFSVLKKFRLEPWGLCIEFELDAEPDMPYMFGYHPAFRIYGRQARIEDTATGRSVSLQGIQAVGSRAFELADCSEVVLKDAHELLIRSSGFGHFMLWTEVDNMLCIEPITVYPYALEQERLHEGFRQLRSREIFTVDISPLRIPPAM